MANIFVSYSRVDDEFAQRCVKWLQRMLPHGEVWWNQQFTGNEAWWKANLKEIAACDIFIYLLSDDSVRSPYCQAQFTEAWRLQKSVILVQAHGETDRESTLGGLPYTDIFIKHAEEYPDGVAWLSGEVYKQLAKVRKKRPLWPESTPLPSVMVHEVRRPANTAHLKTTSLDITQLPHIRFPKPPSGIRKDFLVQLLAAVIGGLILAYILGQLPTISEIGATPVSPTLMPDALQPFYDLADSFRGGNVDWTPIEQDFDGVPMMLVPAGCFMMGSDADEQDEKPAHRVCFEKPFWIDKTEVTQGQFALFGGVAVQANSFGGDNRPVEQVTWFEARDFCAKRAARLPIEAEWEYAGRGPDAWRYPWGNDWDDNKVVWRRNLIKGTSEVGSLPTGASWVGTLDMVGNVWEWVSSLYQDYPYRVDDGREQDTEEQAGGRSVLRGGSWSNGFSGLLRAANRNWTYRVNWGSDRGFRCARSM